MTALTRGIYNREIHRNRKWKRSYEGLEKGRKGSHCLKGREFLYRVMKKLQKYAEAMVAQYCGCA